MPFLLTLYVIINIQIFSDQLYKGNFHICISSLYVFLDPQILTAHLLTNFSPGWFQESSSI